MNRIKPKPFSKDDLIKWALAHGWVQDQYGHLKKSNRRLKLQKTSVRYEEMSIGTWSLRRSDYYKNLSVGADGRLTGLGSVNEV